MAFFIWPQSSFIFLHIPLRVSVCDHGPGWLLGILQSILMGLCKYNSNSAGYDIFEKNCKFFNPYIGILGGNQLP
jgi:hypothetical protein